MVSVPSIVLDLWHYVSEDDAYKDAGRIMHVLINNGYVCVMRKIEHAIFIEFEINDPTGDYGVPNPYWITKDVVDLIG